MARSLIVGLFLSTVFIFSASDAFAQTGVFPTQIVPSVCGGVGTDGKPQPECNICDFAQLLINVLNFTVAFSMLVATGLFAWAGGLMITAQDNAGQRDQAKGIFTNVVIGLIVILGAWLFIDVMMKTFLKDPNGEIGNFGPWNKILCPANFTPSNRIKEAPPPGYVGSYTAPVITGTCANCQNVPNITCKEGANCQLAAGEIANSAANFGKELGDVEMTEGFPPTRNHCANCQYDGTCFDAAISSRLYTTANIQRWVKAAKNNNLRLVFETADCTLKARALSAGMPADAVKCKGQDSGYEHITGTHFSVYGQISGSGGSRCK